VDGWLGSRTSQLAYPIFSQSSSDGSRIDFGTDYETYIKNPKVSEILAKTRAARLQKLP
jgi:hypothetical protein